jgi:hypothetical protein
VAVKDSLHFKINFTTLKDGDILPQGMIDAMNLDLLLQTSIYSLKTQIYKFYLDHW